MNPVWNLEAQRMSARRLKPEAARAMPLPLTALDLPAARGRALPAEAMKP